MNFREPIELTFSCACCFEPNDLQVDPQEGDEQEIIQDCEVCCRPNVITVKINPRTGRAEISSYQEDIG
jgi:hypothetical protein